MSSPIPLEGNELAQRVNSVVKRLEEALDGETYAVVGAALFAVITESPVLNAFVEELRQRYAAHARKHGD